MNSILLNPTDNNEIKDIIGSLNPLKYVVPKNIPTKILKFCKKALSQTFGRVINATLQP